MLDVVSFLIGSRLPEQGHVTYAEALRLHAERISLLSRSLLAAMEDLGGDHGMLDADQREELIDELRSAWRGRWHSDDGPRAQLHALADDLELTDAQRDAIKEKVKAEIEREKPAAQARFS